MITGAIIMAVGVLIGAILTQAATSSKTEQNKDSDVS